MINCGRDEYNSNFGRNLLFIHHSVGKNWLEEGNLRESLIGAGIGVHELTYGDPLGNATDMHHWAPKFENNLDEIIKHDYRPDVSYRDDKKNDLVMFKSCYPNSNIKASGEEPGDPLSDYKAVFNQLKDDFSKKPDVIFIYATSPPLVPARTTEENAGRMREFNEWLKNSYIDEYRSSTNADNFYVFDLFDVLAGEDNYLRKEFRRNDRDSHPNGQGSMAATQSFMTWLSENNLLN